MSLVGDERAEMLRRVVERWVRRGAWISAGHLEELLDTREAVIAKIEEWKKNEDQENHYIQGTLDMILDFIRNPKEADDERES